MTCSIPPFLPAVRTTTGRSTRRQDFWSRLPPFIWDGLFICVLLYTITALVITVKKPFCQLPIDTNAKSCYHVTIENNFDSYIFVG